MKPIEEMNFNELVEWGRKCILAGIEYGVFNESVWVVCESVARWRMSEDKKLANTK